MSQDTTRIETMISEDCRPAVEEIMTFMKELDRPSEEKFLEFLHGVRFALNMLGQNTAI